MNKESNKKRLTKVQRLPALKTMTGEEEYISVGSGNNATPATFELVLEQSSVVMKEKHVVDKKLKQMVDEGPEKLQVITDFDSTLTKSQVNGTPTVHSVDVLNSVSTLSTEFKDGYVGLFEKYNYLACNPNLTEDERQEVLIKWWTGYVELLTNEHITVEDIRLSTEITNTPLRDGCEEMLTLLVEHEVPVYVVSAGIGDVVSHSLRNFRTNIIANFIHFGSKGEVLGFKEPHISVYNKHKFEWPLGSSRHNVVLMGDSIGDNYMADNVPNTNIVLKIGFCSKNDEESKEQYRNKYDVVLVEDETMNVPLALLKIILSL